MTRYFDEIHFDRLKSQVTTYNLPQEEITILKEILDGYKHGYYYLIIPALLARLEGLIFNSVNYEGRTDYNLFNIVIEETINKYKSNHDYYIDDDYEKIKKNYKSKLKKAFKFDDKNINEIIRNSIINGNDKNKEYYKSKLKRAFKFGDKNINRINRHSIMHGYDNKYGTKQNAIMLFLHFEYLYKCLTELNEKDKQYIRNKMENYKHKKSKKRNKQN